MSKQDMRLSKPRQSGCDVTELGESHRGFPRCLTQPANYLNTMLNLTPKPASNTDADTNLRVPLFVLQGPHAGPRLVVSGPKSLMRTLADTFWYRGDLANIHGSLVLRAQGQDLAFDLPDETLVLTGRQDVATSFDKIHSRMIQLGMTAAETSVAA